MIETTRAGTERAGPFPLLEPLGLLWGLDARQAVRSGHAVPLAGGPCAFTQVRCEGVIRSVADAALTWPESLAGLTAYAGSWAGFGPGPLVMGILNATPDSFSDGGRHIDGAAALSAGLRMRDEGADIIDVGGESTRPGSEAVEPAHEQTRILPVVEALARAGVVVSVDTRNAATMRRALDAGARIINDVSALSWDPDAAAMLAGTDCPVVLMHMRGTPATMRDMAQYGDVAMEVAAELSERVAVAVAAGIGRHRVALDPGFGFAKTADQSLELLQRLPVLAGLGLPVLVGISRKSTIGALTGEAEASRRDPGSIAAALLGLARGARMLRVHDVAGTRQAVAIWNGTTA